MEHVAWMVIASLLFLGTSLPPVRPQRTHARQGMIAQDPPTVNVPSQGTLAGREISLSRTQRVTVYFGVPYAQPPLGKRRFSAPVTDPPPSWDGARNASHFWPSCMQISGRRKLHETLYRRVLPGEEEDPGVSEDCLFLNVFVPDGNRPPDGWPVMVWFHGGDFNTGTPAIWDASVFVIKQKVLAVTVAYRLNILGFFTTTDAEASGNYGMLDQIAALDWIQRNIRLFGGSPTNVVIYGHSSGAISVGLHMLSPLSRGKFAKAIAMSGDAVGSVRTPDLEARIVDTVAEKFGCYRTPTSALMQCLRRVDATILVRETSDIETWGPIVDYETNNASEPFLPAHPRDILDGGDFNAVPLLAGYTKTEQALAYMEAIGDDEEGRLSLARFESMIVDETYAAVEMPDENSTCEVKPQMIADAVIFFYRPHPPNPDRRLLRDRYLDLQTEKNYAAGLTLLAGKVSRYERAFVYRFDYRPRTPAVIRDVPDWAGVPHMFELQFVWGLPYAVAGPVQWNAADKRTADVMMTAFANFARSGNPSQLNVKWEPFTEESPRILTVNRTIEMSDANAVDYKALAFWNEYYPLVVEEATNNCCNVTGSSARLAGLRGIVAAGVLTALTSLRIAF